MPLRSIAVWEKDIEATFSVVQKQWKSVLGMQFPRFKIWRCFAYVHIVSNCPRLSNWENTAKTFCGKHYSSLVAWSWCEFAIVWNGPIVVARCFCLDSQPQWYGCRTIWWKCSPRICCWIFSHISTGSCELLLFTVNLLFRSFKFYLSLLHIIVLPLNCYSQTRVKIFLSHNAYDRRGIQLIHLNAFRCWSSLFRWTKLYNFHARHKVVRNIFLSLGV